MAWLQPAAAAAAPPQPYIGPYYQPGDPRTFYYTPGQWGYGLNGQPLSNLVVPIAQPQQVLCGHRDPYSHGANGPPIINNGTLVYQPYGASYHSPHAAPGILHWPAATTAFPAASLDVPLYGRRPEDYYSYPPRLPAHRDGSVPGLEYIPVLRDGWADYRSRTNHAVAPPVCDKC